MPSTDPSHTANQGEFKDEFSRNDPGRLLRPDPPVRRTLTAYTRASPDPLTAAFIDVLAQKATVLPAHVRRELGLE